MAPVLVVEEVILSFCPIHGMTAPTVALSLSMEVNWKQPVVIGPQASVAVMLEKPVCCLSVAVTSRHGPDMSANPQNTKEAVPSAEAMTLTNWKKMSTVPLILPTTSE